MQFLTTIKRLLADYFYCTLNDYFNAFLYQQHHLFIYLCVAVCVFILTKRCSCHISQYNMQAVYVFKKRKEMNQMQLLRSLYNF